MGHKETKKNKENYEHNEMKEKEMKFENTNKK
jgi:hypothetical protein